MSQLQTIEAIEKRLWTAADQLRANSDLASNEYFMPVMGLIFLRHAYSRYLAVKPQIEAGLPSRGGVTRPLTKEDFSQPRRNLPPTGGAVRPSHQPARFGGPCGRDRHRDGSGIGEPTTSALKGVLPKSGVSAAAKTTTSASILRIFNDPELQNSTGDIFGRIYEYFLTQFADQSAHDGGEFFTPAVDRADDRKR
jgi:type I restriction enzyme M protein